MPVQIRLLAAPDAPALRSLRLAALAQAPRAFGSSLEEEQPLDLDHFRRWAEADAERALFGAFVDGHLAGMTGLARHNRRKTCHKAYIWGVYVDPGQRGLGLSRQLLEAALARAAAMPGVSQVQLTVAADNAAAISVYRRLGFVEYGREPEALCVAGEMIDEVLMSRRIA
jgi:ribosomal protein S18 acetylase RimI-like enzyme